MFIGYDRSTPTLLVYVPWLLSQYGMKYVYLTSSTKKDGWKIYFESLIYLVTLQWTPSHGKVIQETLMCYLGLYSGLEILQLFKKVLDIITLTSH